MLSPNIDLASALQRHFGFPSFRPGQAEAVQSLREGRHTLVVMPTGAGKSLVFQLTALLRQGLTLVVSPLIALMKDQVDALERRGIAATYINSTLPVSEQNARLQRLTQGAYRLVYVAPERLRSVPLLNALQNQRIGLLAVDEAHCISEWGHDFRPDYLHLAEARRRLGNPLTAALTATATPQVQNDIARLLELGEARRIVTGFNRPNLYFEVRYASGTDPKLRALSELLSQHQTGAAIVYTGTRRDAEEVTGFLQEVLHLHAEFYHAGLPAEERARIQNEFIAGRLNVICATNAFGMGIDRADVRQVIHYSMPGSLEAYYQEAGRAGRDGQPAQAILLYDPQDRALQEFFIANSALSEDQLRALYQAIRNGGEVWLSIDDLSLRTNLHPVQIRVGLAALERAEALQHLGDEGLRMLYRKGEWQPNAIAQAIARNRAHLQHRYRQLEGIVRYAETNACRRRVILQHFGDTGAAEAPRCCDNCLETATRPEVQKEAGEMTPGERAALIVLDCVRRARVPVGREKLAQILHGSKAQDIRRFHHDRNPYYGKLAAVRQGDIEAVIAQLVEKGYLKTIGGEYPVLALTRRGEQAIEQKEAIVLRLPRSFAPEAVQRAKEKLQAGGTVAYTAKLLTEGLSVKAIARRRGLAVSTIYGHCAQLIERGLLEVGRVVPADVQAQIQTAIQRAGKVHSLSAIKTLLPETIEYGMIRCVLAARGKPAADPVAAFLSSPHPRPLKGIWQVGFALDFHSTFRGADWNRSAIGELVYRLKYEDDRSALPLLVQHTLALFAAQPQMTEFDVIVPVPPSTPRPFQPLDAYCQALAQAVGKPMKNCLVKTHPTQPQKEMSTLAQKRANVAGAFTVQGKVTEERILLVDDLYDSGATLEEITRLLLQHGARQVNALTWTRTIHVDA
jgi:ATP-dependent DNA helicase RecQ